VNERILGTPAVFVRQSMQSSTYPKRGSASWDRMPFLYERLQSYDDDIGCAVDDLYDVMQSLRETKNFEQSDRIRTIAGRLARARRRDDSEKGDLIRSMARGWPDPLLTPAQNESSADG